MNDTEREAVARKWTTLSDPLQHFMFIVFIVDDNGHQTPIGTAGLGWIGSTNAEKPADEARTGSMGAMLEPFARGRGYAFESLRMVIDYGFRELQMVNVSVGTKSVNAAMRGLMEKKFGMKAEVRETEDMFGNDLFRKIDHGDWLTKVASRRLPVETRDGFNGQE
ncbi:hypothetical protein V1504DRAFT_335078 [Lipomyces starkeyi]